MSTYHTIITNAGKQLFANAINSSNKVNISHLSLGDGNGNMPTPNATRTRLVNERTKVAVNDVKINASNANWLEVSAIIPSNNGGYTVREIGLYAGNTLVAIGNFPATYKPSANEGGAREMSIKVVIALENASVVNVSLDNSLVYATQKWVEQNFVNHNEVVNNLTSTDTTKPLSANMGRSLQGQIDTIDNKKLGKTDNAVSSSKLATPRTIALTGDVSGQTHFDGSANVGIGVTLANTGVRAGVYNAVTVDTKGRVTAGQTVVNGLITATTATGTANQATTNANTYLNLVTTTGASSQSTGSSTKITGTTGVSVASDTQGSLIISGTRATDTAVGVTVLSHNTNGADKTKAASEFALGEVRRMANQAQVTADGIALTWSNVQNKPTTFTPSTHRHNWSEIDRVPVASMTTLGITQLNDSLTSTANNQALTANQGKILNDKINELDGNKMPLKGRLSQNLNMLNADYTGIWQQSQNAQAHTSLNYPVQKAGTLWVLPSAYTGQQLYLPWDGSVLYTRNTTNSGSWSDWRAIGEVQDVLNSDSRSAGLSARQGKILDEKLTELDNQAVKTTGNQNIVGIKQYASVQKATAGLEFAVNKENFDAGRYGVLGANANSAYIKNNQTGKFLELRHNGVLAYDSQKVWLYNDKSDAINLDDTDKIATAKAVKTLNDVKLGKNDNAVSASKLATVRNIAMTGDGSWNVNFDGSQNASATMTLANTGVTAGTYNWVTVDAKGRVTAGLAQTHRLVTTNNSQGAANVATGNSNTFLNIVSSALSGTNSVGSSTQITGINGISVSSDTQGRLIVTRDSNSPTASKLQTARTINGVAFDGSQDITVFDDTKLGKTENAVSASRLQTARNIALTGAVTGTASFDGSRNVSISTTDDNSIGLVAFFAMNQAPSGWLKANGAAVSRTTYAKLFAKIGTTFGAGDGRTTFNLPDLRGEFIRGFDDGRNVDNGRAFGSQQVDAIRNITGSIKLHEMMSADTADGVFSKTDVIGSKSYRNPSSGNHYTVQFDASTQVPTANENRPRNIALLACIKF